MRKGQTRNIQKMLFANTSAAYIEVHFRQDIIKEDIHYEP